MNQKHFFVVLTSIKNFRSRYYFLKDDLICSSDEPVPHAAEWLAKDTVDRFIEHTSAMTKGQLLDLFGEYELQLHVKEVDGSDSVENAKVVAMHDIEPIAFKNGIIAKGFETGKCLTVRELKAIVANWPELTDDYKPTEVWIATGFGFSSGCKSLGALNHRDNHADLILEPFNIK